MFRFEQFSQKADLEERHELAEIFRRRLDIFNPKRVPKAGRRALAP